MSKAPNAIDTASKRAKLAARKNPYWHGVSGGRGGVSLGYRKPTRGPGSWVAKIVVDGSRIEERISSADDLGAGPDALDYPKAVTRALEWARQTYAGMEARQAGECDAAAPTVRSAILAYIAARKSQSRHGRDAHSRLTKH